MPVSDALWKTHNQLHCLRLGNTTRSIFVCSDGVSANEPDEMSKIPGWPKLVRKHHYWQAVFHVRLFAQHTDNPEDSYKSYTPSQQNKKRRMLQHGTRVRQSWNSPPVGDCVAALGCEARLRQRG